MLARFQHGAEVEVEIHAGLLPARMQPQREAFAISTPKFGFAEGLGDWFAGGEVGELEVLENFPDKQLFDKISY